MEQLASASDILAINQRLDNLTKYCVTKSIANKGTMSIADIAEFEGVSRGFLYGAGAYLLPRYGKSGYPDNAGARWNTEEYLKWREIKPEIRQQAFEEINKKAKKSAKAAISKKNRLNGPETEKEETC